MSTGWKIFYGFAIMYFGVHAITALISGIYGLALGNGMLLVSDILHIVRSKKLAGKTTYFVIDRIYILGVVLDVCGILLLFKFLP